MKRRLHKKESEVMSNKSKNTKEFTRKGSLLKNLPLPLFAKEGYISSLWQREGKRDFINQCLYPYDRISTRQLKGFASPPPAVGGFTLIELLIALVISMVIIGAIYGSYISQQRSYIAQDQVAEMNSTSKIALDMIVNDIRETGFGLPEAGTYNINGFTNLITATDSTTAPDQITLLGGFRRAGTLCSTSTGDVISPSDTQLILRRPSDSSQWIINNGDGENISFGGISYAVITGGPGTGVRETITILNPIGKGFPRYIDSDSNGLCDDREGVPVYLVEDITYQVVDTRLQRVRRLNGGSPETDVIAENIEDFQIAYGVDTDSDGVIDLFRNAPLASDSLLRIRLNLLARTSRPDPNFQGQGNPPAAIENRNHSSTDDSLRRRLWQMEVAMRNPLL
jgi:type IV pilus assembly protein PilW